MKTIGKWIGIGLLILLLFYAFCSREQKDSALYNSEKEREKLTQQLEDKDKELEEIKASIEEKDQQANEDKAEADELKEENTVIVYVPSGQLLEQGAELEVWQENYQKLEMKYELSENRCDKLESALQKKDEALRLAKLNLSLKYEEMLVIQDARYGLLQKDYASLKIEYNKLKSEIIVVSIGPAGGVTPQGDIVYAITVQVGIKLKGIRLPKLLRWIR